MAASAPGPLSKSRPAIPAWSAGATAPTGARPARSRPPSSAMPNGSSGAIRCRPRPSGGTWRPRRCGTPAGSPGRRWRHRLGAVGHSRQGAGRAGVAAPGRQDARPAAPLLDPLRLDARIAARRACWACPKVETTDDLRRLAEEVLERGFTAIKTNMLRLKDRPDAAVATGALPQHARRRAPGGDPQRRPRRRDLPRGRSARTWASPWTWPSPSSWAARSSWRVRWNPTT